MTGAAVERAKLRGVIFDKDGTLFDFAGTWAVWATDMIRTEAQGDPARAAAIADAIRFDLEQANFAPDSPAIAGTAQEVCALIAPHLPPERRDGLLTRMDDSASQAPLAPVCDLVACMTDLRSRGLSLAVVTNDAEAPTHAHLATSGITDLVDFVAGYDSGHGAKPDAGPILAAADAMGCTLDEVVMVGDSLTDLHAARAAGVTGIGVLTGPAREVELSTYAEAVLPSIAELIGWISTSGR